MKLQGEKEGERDKKMSQDCMLRRRNKGRDHKYLILFVLIIKTVNIASVGLWEGRPFRN